MKNLTYPLLLFVFLWSAAVTMQAQRFSAGVGTGIIISQMDGDGFKGYDKVGKRIGIRGTAYLSETLDLVVEMNWEEKGAKFETVREDHISSSKDRSIQLSYAEIPVIARFFRNRRGGLFGELGVSISYLVKDTYETADEHGSTLNSFEELSPDFNRYEWNAILGGGYEFNRHFGVLFRTTIGFSYLYRNPEALEGYLNRPSGSLREEPIVQLRNYLMSVGVYYTI